MSSPDDKRVESGDAAVTSNCGDRVDTPNPNDVLCGRGGNINSHRGNEQFRSFVEKRKRVYLTARFKREKRLIASSIVNEIRAMDPPGRFLARKGSMKDNSGYWYDIGDEKARDKTSQALRENAPSIRAEIETEINQQRAEMRRQETSVDQPSSSSKTATKPSYPPPPLGHHANPHGAVCNDQRHGHHPPPTPPPHMGHLYNQAHQNHYSQQYYDYYYHYYGYGAPPPPPPPGYTSSGAPPPPPPPGYTSSGVPVTAGAAAPSQPPGYPPAPPPYWTGQSNQNANASPPVTKSASPHLPNGSTAASAARMSSPVPSAHSNDLANRKESDMDADSAVHSPHPSSITMQTQEEEDRRLAMTLQQEENAKAFEDRNRRFGSDRRSSRSTAYCAPGYRPRLLNDNVDRSGGVIGSSPSKKKRPAMSASYYFAEPSGDYRDNRTDSNIVSKHLHDGSASNNANRESDADMNMEDHYDMNLKPAATRMRRQENITKNNGDLNNDHDQHVIGNNHQDFSCSSFSSRGRVQFKDDSDIISLFGEGDTIIPSSNANSTGSFNRIRNTFANGNQNTNNTGNHQFNPIALDQGERNHQRQQRSQQCDSSRRDNESHHQDSSLLSQVSHHILGNLGLGGASWTTDDADKSRNHSNKQDHVQNHEENMESEMELGQEVIMDVRDESSSMPPPFARGSGTQVDWASKAGCHSWIPDAIGYSEPSSSRFGENNNDRVQHDNHDLAHQHTNGHSLTRQTSYGRSDISPINSMDMDFSRSSTHGGGQHRSNINNDENSGGAHTSSLMNVFDHKDLQEVPSWERSYHSRSTLSLGEMTGVSGTDDSLIRVNSYAVKDKLFGIVGKKKAGPSGHKDGHQPRHHSENRHVQEHEKHDAFTAQSQSFNGTRNIDMDWD